MIRRHIVDREKPEIPIQRRTGKGPAKTVRHRSKMTLFGLPLVDIASGPDPDRGEKHGKAHGIIAVGDEARGWLALGGKARGLIAMGGQARGLLAMGGKARGLIAMGGQPAGVLAMGGAPVGLVAMGGVAVGVVAVGGLALGVIAAGGRAAGLISLKSEKRKRPGLIRSILQGRRRAS